MTDNEPPQSGWVSEQQALLALVVLSVVLTLLIIVPYVQFVLLAIVLAYVLWPLQGVFERRYSPTLSALLVTFVALLAILLPLAYFIQLALRQALSILRAIERGDINVALVEARLEDVGISVDLVELYDAQRDTIAAAGERAIFEVLLIARSLPRLFIGLTITLFVMFALLRDGEALLAWLQVVAPVRNDVQSEFIDRLDRLMWASIIGNVGASAIQAVALGIGLALLGFDNVILLTVATFILALLPLVGAFIVWVPLVVYLAMLGDHTAGAILFIYGTIVSLSDFYTRPLVIGKSGALNAAIVVVGVFGGIVVFGPVGLFLGPVVVGGTKISLDLYARERAASRDRAALEEA